MTPLEWALGIGGGLALVGCAVLAILLWRRERRVGELERALGDRDETIARHEAEAVVAQDTVEAMRIDLAGERATNARRAEKVKELNALLDQCDDPAVVRERLRDLLRP